ncbi:VWA domain-containing protein [Parageobacillus toebii NBRC 107807]|uniref:Nitric oxide reductase activation protein n=1 Tax=Parageobacillus toebii NBRC 107807 TaxID=1223503 RepID=A0A6G9J5V8_9BACL|nr:VWA domain-containing protein [Parageobacillus toebii]MBB3869858.1 nitric oxide reductase activation protein [Parageobacillus toebii NBRC 107807]QIQ33552.1 VWA domain-containing protein [Parageobacillus toebii NBRC 107807]
MERFIQFNDKKIDSFLFMQLSDLAKTLAKHSDWEVEFGFQSYVDFPNRKLYVSHFWDNRPKEEKENGLKSDVCLRAVGTLFHTDFSEVTAFLNKTKNISIPSFAKQLFTLAEDLRLEEICKKERPGTKKWFRIRRDVYRRYFYSQTNANLTRSVYTDALFSVIYLLLTSDSPLEDVPIIHEPIDRMMPWLRQTLPQFFDAASTKEVARITWMITEAFDDVLENDMLNTYFYLPEQSYNEEMGLTLEDLKRIDPLNNCDILDKEKCGDEDVHDQELPTWHRETSDMTKSFLRFELEQGSRTDLLGDGAREGEDGDQALAMVQGSARKSNRNDYRKLNAYEQKRESKQAGKGDRYGKDNRYAEAIFLFPTSPSSEQIAQYEQKKIDILPYQKKLKQMMKKTLEHKKTLPRTDLHFGRLHKKLLRLWTEEQPRLFYKKHQPSSRIDAVFTLLVDCSASMYDKMEETKRGIILFHEALKSLLVPHQIVGFWEDPNEATETKQPNYFQTVISFAQSHKKESGPAIMQLEAQEDNRDGFAIRIITEQLLKRPEKQKFLLVFSDGEPAAFGYEQNGIIDTHEAVLEARKHHIEVINVFLANGEIDEGQRETIRNIYGKHSIVVPNVEQLPDFLFPLLKKLLYKSL